MTAASGRTNINIQVNRGMYQQDQKSGAGQYTHNCQVGLEMSQDFGLLSKSGSGTKHQCNYKLGLSSQNNYCIMEKNGKLETLS